MERFKTDGIIIKSSVTGESDRIVWILSRDRGIIRAFAKGARGTKSRLHAAASLFSYCDFVIFEKNNVFTVNEAEIKEIFFELRTNLNQLALAQYFCEVILKSVPDSQSDELCLRLLLNSLHLLSKGIKPDMLIKSVFELRLASEAGFMPALAACESCGAFSSREMYFDCASGLLFCNSCGDFRSLPSAPLAVISAMRHIIYSPFDKIFSFELASHALSKLNRFTEQYLLQCFDQHYKTLEFLKAQRE